MTAASGLLGGGTIYLRGGTYTITGTITVGVGSNYDYTTIIFDANTILSFPGAALGDKILDIEASDVTIIGGQFQGSGQRGNGIGINLGGTSQTVYRCRLIVVNISNCANGIVIGIIDMQSSGDNCIYAPFIFQCQNGIKSQGFTNYVYGGSITHSGSDSAALWVTSDRTHSQIRVFGLTFANLYGPAIKIDGGIDSVFEGIWVDTINQINTNFKSTIIIGSTSNQITNATFRDIHLVGGGESSGANENYAIEFINAQGTLIEDLGFEFGGSNNSQPALAWIIEDGTSSGMNNVIRNCYWNINWGGGTNTESGTSTSSTAGNNKLQDNTKTWTANQWTNYFVTIVNGTGTGQTRLISSNTSTTLTVASNWNTNPDTTSQYIIAPVIPLLRKTGSGEVAILRQPPQAPPYSAGVTFSAGLVARPFDNSNNFCGYLGLRGASSTPMASRDYTVVGSPIMITASGTTTTYTIKDDSNNVVASISNAVNQLVLPRGYKINFGSSPPTNIQVAGVALP